MTQEEYIEKVININKDKFDLSNVVYKGYDSKVNVRCNKCGVELNIPAHRLLKEYNCKYCKYKIDDKELQEIINIPIDEKTKNFINKAKEVHNSNYSYEYTRYKNQKTKVIIKCNECNRLFKQLPYDHLKGHGCPYCGDKNKSKSQKYTKEEIIQKAKQIHKDKYDYSKIIYNGWNEPIENIKCNRCDRYFNQKAKYHLKGHGCPYCNKTSNKLSQEEFIKRVENIYGENIFDFSKTKYINKKLPVVVTCKRHNIDIEVKAEYLLKGTKICPLCNNEQNNFKGIKLNTQLFIERAKEIHGDKFDYSITNYEHINKKVKIKCNRCNNILHIEPYVHLNGAECPVCSINNQKLTQEEFLNRISYLSNIFDFSKVKYNSMYEPITIICKNCNREFEKPAIYFLQSPICPYCNRSSFEIDVYNYIIELLGENTKIEIHNTQELKPYEIDIYLPEYKIGVECHGIFWHGLTKYNLNKWNKLKTLHQIKADLADIKGITLLQIFEYEWNNDKKRRIWQDIIKHKLGLIENRIYARETIIKEIDKSTAKEFLDEYHLHGGIYAPYNYGLFYNNRLVAVANFGKDRFTKSKNNTFELYRFATITDTVIVGGISKLIKYFVNKVNPDKLITFADRRYSSINNSVYSKINFKYLYKTNPDYRYLRITENDIKIYHRTKYQKHKLKDILPNYSDKFTELENMILLNDYIAIFDAGNYKFEYIRG